MRRLIGWLARFATSLLLRRVEVADLDRLPRGRPVLLVANHFNGFVDPLVIASALGRLPRFVAKDALRSVPVRSASLLRAAGVVFVRRREDRARRRGQQRGRLRRVPSRPRRARHGRHLPRGHHPRPAPLDPIKTGAARIALGARAAGANDLVVVPVGLTFPDKVALRASALVQIGHADRPRRRRPGAASVPTTRRRCASSPR